MQVNIQDNPVIDFLQNRRSVLARNMRTPGPDRDTLEIILSIGARVPDHGKLTPWRFVVIEGDDCAKLGDIAAMGLAERGEEPDMIAAARAQFLRAPCVVAVLACPRVHPKIPRSEQIYSAGAACMLLTAAAQAAGFAAQWLTGSAAYDTAIRARLGGGPDDEITGFIYIGTRTEEPAERTRPPLDDIAVFALPETSAE